MTKFDTIFNDSAIGAGLSWVFMYDNADRSIRIDSEVTDYPCILRSFRESTVPLFDAQQRWEKQLLLYIVHTGFASDTSEQLNENLEEIMLKFIQWRELMRRAGVEVTINSKPFPQWEQTDDEEYGYIFDLTCKYSICQY
jgi:hypothetical protein